MFSPATLKNHPFAVEAYFESSLVLSYAVPKKEIEHLVPACLQLDTYDNQWAFVAVAVVKTKNLRPKGFPVWMGNDFVLLGFRVFVRYTNNNGKKLRGLYILKSETNKRKMSFFGNIFTHYNYTATDIDFVIDKEKITVHSQNSLLDIEVGINSETVKLPAHSPFKDWKEARRFAGPLPFTFTYNHSTKEVLIIEGVRENWIPKPVEVIKSSIGFIQQQAFKGIILANAFITQNIPYCWEKGKIEIWEG